MLGGEKMDIKRICKRAIPAILVKVVAGVVVWLLGLVASVGMAYFFTDLGDWESLAQKAGTVVMKELRKNKEQVVETVQVLAKEYHAQNPEAVKKFLFNHKDLTIKIINESFPEYEKDVRDILKNVSPEAQKETKKILDEITLNQ